MSVCGRLDAIASTIEEAATKNRVPCTAFTHLYVTTAPKKRNIVGFCEWVNVRMLIKCNRWNNSRRGRDHRLTHRGRSRHEGGMSYCKRILQAIVWERVKLQLASSTAGLYTHPVNARKFFHASKYPNDSRKTCLFIFLFEYFLPIPNLHNRRIEWISKIWASHFKKYAMSSTQMLIILHFNDIACWLWHTVIGISDAFRRHILCLKQNTVSVYPSGQTYIFLWRSVCCLRRTFWQKAPVTNYKCTNYAMSSAHGWNNPCACDALLLLTLSKSG